MKAVLGREFFFIHEGCDREGKKNECAFKVVETTMINNV